ncbi:MAG: hypothetical protein R2754_05195 [Microthrixaceae bacterium]
MLLSVMLALAVVATGTGLTTWLAPELSLEERVFVGAALGVLVVSVCALGAFAVVGMGWPAVGLGLAVPAAAGFAGVQRNGERLRSEVAAAMRRLRLPSKDAASLRPLAVTVAASGAVTTRVVSLAYQRTPAGLSAGSLAVWGDWSAHLAYAGSFAYGDNRGFDQPIASGHGFRYHLLADFFGSIFTVSGATLPQALVISEWVLAVALPGLIWCAVMRLTNSRLTSALTLVLFALSGGVGLWYFAADVERDGWSILGALPRTYARIPEAHLWVDNTISSSLYAQRATLLGLAVGCAALIIVSASRPARSRSGLVAAGLMVGALGIGHAHTLMTALALGAMAMIVDRSRLWWWFLVPAAAVGLPLTWAILPETSSMRWMVGWIAPEAGQPWAWFWIRNVGLLLPLFLAVSLVGGATAHVRRLTAPLWLWFLVPNLVAFHPFAWNNTKFFLYWQLAACLAIGNALARMLAASWGASGLRRWGTQLGLVMVGLLLVSAGSLDLLRSTQRSARIEWVTNDDLEAAAWLRRHSRPDEVIVYGASNTSAVAALSGRRSVSGFEGWTYDLGIADWSERAEASLTVLAGEDGTDDAVRRYGIDFVVIGDHERRELGASDDYWEQHGSRLFGRGDTRIYAVR